MRVVLALVSVLVIALFAGCASSTGTLDLGVKDAPDSIGDFSSLTVHVSSIVLTTNDGKDKSYSPAASTFDLTKLTGANTTTLFKDKVDAGNYTKLTIQISSAQGTLTGGKTVDVKVPSDSIFVNTPFAVESGKTTSFTFDIQVHQEGNQNYILKPNASGSEARKAS